MVDHEDGEVRPLSERGEEAQEGADGGEAGLNARGGAGERVDHKKGGFDPGDHFDEKELLHRFGKVYGAGRVAFRQAQDRRGEQENSDSLRSCDIYHERRSLVSRSREGGQW